jgi:hypothetical protein
VLVGAAITSSADVIHLKNGRTIWAEQVREGRDRVEYDVGDNTFAIPRSSVERIESGGVAPEYAHSGSSAIPDLVPSAPSFTHESEVAGKVIRDGKVDIDALHGLQKEGDAELAATGYFLAGKKELDHGNFPQAKQYFETALGLQPENATLLIYYAAALLRTGHQSEALSYAERASRVDPNSADALAMLGFAEFANDHTPQAIRWWKKSLEIRPDATVSAYVAKAQREQNAEIKYSLRESSHFSLHFEGKETSPNLPADVLATLEHHYDNLSNDLGYSPQNSIVVTLYTEQAFFDVTQAPSWSTALNDGKLRIPTRGLTTVTPDLSRILKHELTHSFLTQMSAGRCPTWLQEGAAQVEEGKSVGPAGHQLAELFNNGHEIPLNMLENNFTNFSSGEAVLAYAESLSAVEYLRDTYGMSDIARIVKQLQQGSSTEAALRMVIHSDYGRLQADMAQWLKEKYGE